MKRVALLVGLAGLAGCPSFVSLQTARALDQGEFEATAAASVIGITDNGTQAKQGGASPDIYLAARYGVTEGFDVGLKIQPALGFMATTTIQLYHGNFLDLALTPDVGYFRVPGPIEIGTNESIEQLSTLANYSIVPIDLPLLIGFTLAHDHQLVLGPRLSGWISVPQGINDATGTTTQTGGGLELFAGGAVGMSFKVADSVRVMPEVDVMKPISWSGASAGTCGEYSCSPYPQNGVIWQLSLGFTTGIAGGSSGGDGFL